MASDKEQVIGATSIEEQLIQMKEMFAMMTKTLEEKDLKTPMLVSKIGAQHDEGSGSGSKKGGDEEEEPPVEKTEEKSEPDQTADIQLSVRAVLILRDLIYSW